MSPITVPYHLLLPAIISLAVLSFILIRKQQLFGSQFKKRFWVSVIFLTTYTLIVGGATFDDIYYQWDLNRYDLDGNGSFGSNEITPEQEAAMQMLINDLGRNLSVITGLVFSAILAITAYLILLISDRVAHQRPN